ncbi:MAG: NHL repeat-containing protein [Lentisphaerae bacterium]|nr:NHL repeat-containing protein [Lentisphaerota bacterium]
MAALADDHSPRAAIGQDSLLQNVLNQPAATSLFYAYDLVSDPTAAGTRLYVADTFNSRVLMYECGAAGCSIGGSAAASRVFGHAEMTRFESNGGATGSVTSLNLAFPRAVAVGPNGWLYIADTDNNRIMVHVNPLVDSLADYVLGQDGMTVNTAGSTSRKVNRPEGVWADSAGRLWVADTGNNRMMRFATIATGAAADLIMGGAGAPSATTLNQPTGVRLDAAGRLWVADKMNSRVLAYLPPLVTGKAASIVLGQTGSFTSGTANKSGLGAHSLAYPEKLHLDAGGNLWVADTGNHRVLRYEAPLTSGQPAGRVLGQTNRSQVPTFATNVHDAPDGFPNASGMWGPRGLLTDTDGTLWVCDRDNSRLLAFENPLGTAPEAYIADRVVGKLRFDQPYANQPTERRMNNPVGVGVHRGSTPNRLWVSDIGNSRVLGYADTQTITNGTPATLVLGQPTLTNGEVNAGLSGPLMNAVNAVASAQSLCFPVGVAVGPDGTVYVADQSNSRVLAFHDPFTFDTTADRVFGKSSFSQVQPQFPYGTAQSLMGPEGVCLDLSGNLWVADTLNNRVVRFPNPGSQPTTGAAADLCIGQAGFVSSSASPPYAPGLSATRLNNPHGVHVGPSGRLYVADTLNNRVLAYAPPFYSGMPAFAVFGQATFVEGLSNRGVGATAATLSEPGNIMEDAQGNVYVSDTRNNRLLKYNVPFGGGDLVADEVYGQSTMTTSLPLPPSPASLYSPSALAPDSFGNLFVADTENSRVLRFRPQGPPDVILDDIPSPLIIGNYVIFTGTGFTSGSVIKLYVANTTGVQPYGPFVPDLMVPGMIFWLIPYTVAPGSGFASVEIINTDQGYIRSPIRSQLLYGNFALNMPTIHAVNGVALSPPLISTPLANVQTVLPKGAVVTLGGNGFRQDCKVNIFTSTGNLGPVNPLPGVTASQVQFTLPASAPTGPGSIQIVNYPYMSSTVSAAVSVPIGATPRIDSVSQSGSQVTVSGDGFCVLTVINLFNRQGSGAVNLGGLLANGAARIPLTLVSAKQFRFTVPAGAVTGPAFIEALNPPFIAFSSSGTSPTGGFTITR